MAVARPPTYRPGSSIHPQVRKPRRKPIITPWGRPNPNFEPKVQAPTVKYDTAVAQSPQQQATASAMGQDQAPTFDPTKPPPQTYAGQQERQNSDLDYQSSIDQINHLLMEAARQYGGAGSVAQYGLDPNNPMGYTASNVAAPSDDLSQVAGIQRAFDQNVKSSDNNANADNTFFSGLHAKDRTDLSNERGRQIESARRAYEDAVTRLTQQLMGAQTSHRNAYSDAVAQEIQYAMGLAPEPESNTVPAPPTATTAAPSGARPTSSNPTAHGPIYHWGEPNPNFKRKPRRK